MTVTNTSYTQLAELEEAGFHFPECLGQSRHPFLDEKGQPRDPRTIGFEPCTIGGGTDALCLEFGRFRIIVLSEDGCGIPETVDWAETLISVDVDASGPNGYDLLCMTGQEWKYMCA